MTKIFEKRIATIKGRRPSNQQQAVWTLVLGSMLLGCLDTTEPLTSATVKRPVQFEPVTICIQTGTSLFALAGELAETPEQRAQGLMERKAIPEDYGMLFTYERPQAADRGFWMYRTRAPLDIAFLDSNGKILKIHSMEPCNESDPSRCQRYLAGQAFVAALEVRQGFFSKRGVGVADHVTRISGSDCSRLAPLNAASQQPRE